MKHITYRQNLTTTFLSKKARPPPRDIPASKMITHIIIILFIFHVRPIAFCSRAHYVLSEKNLKKFVFLFGIFLKALWKVSERG